MTAARALERLYGAPLKEFTRTRNSLAAELRISGDAEAAREVAGLRRPSVPLWAVNQLARHARAPLERFLDAVDRLRRTQLSDPRGAMQAMRAERTQLDTLVQRAAEALAEAGHSASPATRRRIGDTLLGAATDRAHAEALAHGRLTEELHAPGFDALTGTPRLRVVQGGASRRDGAAARDDAAARARNANVDARDATARAREAKALDRARRAEQHRQQAEERRRQAETRRQEAQARAAEVAALRREEAAARARLAEVQRQLKAARRGRRDG